MAPPAAGGKPAVVSAPGVANNPAALADALAKAAGKGVSPAVVAPVVGGLIAATGQAAAPQPVVIDNANAAALADALAKTQAVTPVAPKVRPNPAAASPITVAPGVDASAAAAAQGQPVVVDALSAPATLGQNATAVVVTQESARSSAEDFGTSIAAAVAAAAGKGPVVNSPAGTANGKNPVVIAPGTVTRGGTDPVVIAPGVTVGGGNQPVVIAPGVAVGGGANPVVVAPGGTVGADGQPVVVATPGQQTGTGNSNSDDNGDLLAKLALAGLGAYAVGQMINSHGQQGRVDLNTGDRVVVTAADGSQQILKDDNALLLQPGSQVATENFPDGSSRSIVTRGDGSRVVTIRDAQLRVLRRTLVGADGSTTELINDAAAVEPVRVSELPPAARPIAVAPSADPAALRAALQQETGVSRRFSLSQVRNIAQVRSLIAPISIDSITFDTGSAAIQPSQAQQLSSLGATIADMVRANPREVFLVEGYTDTVGQPASNLALSDRRAESLALALSEYFGVPPENLVVQGYGENYLRVSAEGDVRANRRVAVRRVTDLLKQ